MHPSRDELSGYVLGSLAEDAAQVVESHLAECPACEDTLLEIEASSDTVIEKLRHGPRVDPYENEDGCRDMISLIRAIGREPSIATAQAAVAEADAPDLGYIREYQLLAELGKGGMGTVYKALHTKLDRVVALKLLSPERTKDPGAVDRFQREMKAVGRLEHPNIVRATDAGEQDGTHFLVMEYVEGKDLSQVVEKVGPLPIADACEVIRQAAVGLQCAHEHGMVHRDIKPSNLMLTQANRGREPTGTSASRGREPTGSVNYQLAAASRSPFALIKVLDLGLALLDPQKGEANGNGGSDLTSDGQIMGTFDYMAPEQADDSHEVTIAADIYSLGATLYKLLTGRAPFEDLRGKKPAARIIALATAEPPPITQFRDDIPADLAAIVHKMLAKTAEARFATPAEVAAALTPFAAKSNLPALLVQAGVATADSSDSDLHRATDPHLSASLTDTVSTVDHPQPSTTWQRPIAIGSFRIPRWKAVAIGAAAVAVLILLGVLFTLQTPKGTVVVEVDERYRDDISLVFRRGGREIEINDKTGWQVKLKDGQYEVDFGRGSDRFELSDNKIAVLRGKRQILTVTLKSDRATPLPADIAGAGRLQPQFPPIETTDPISSLAMVTRPAKLKGLRSWTVETTEPRGEVHEVAFSPNGKLLATAGDDGTIRLFEPKSMKLVRAILGHDDAVLHLAWSPNGQTLASASEDETVRLWNTATGELLHTVPWVPQGVPDISDTLRYDHKWLRWHGAFLLWSPDGSLLATRDHDGVHVWNTQSGDLHFSLDGHDGWVFDMTWSPDGERLATAGGDKTARIWDAATGKQLQVLSGHEHAVYTVAWSPGAKLLASGSRDRSVRLWEPESGEFVRSLEGEQVLCHDHLVWSPDGQMLAGRSLGVGNYGQHILLWDLNSNQPPKSIRTFHSSERLIQVRWSPNGRELAYNGNFVRVESGEMRHFEIVDDVFDVSPDWTRIASTGPHRFGLTLCESSSATILQTLPGHTPLDDITWSLTGHAIAARHRAIPVVWSNALDPWFQTVADKRANSLAWSPDGKELALGGVDSYGKSLETWDIEGQQLQLKLACDGGVGLVAWSPNGNKLVCLTNGGRTSRIWDARSGRELQPVEHGKEVSRKLMWLPDSSRVMTSMTGIVHIDDTESGSAVASRKVGAWTGGIAWHPDGRRVAIHGARVCVYDEQLGEQFIERKAYASTASPVAWSSDGTLLVFVGEDGRLVYLDRQTGLVDRRVDVPSPIGVLSPDQRFLTYTSTNMVRLFDVENERPHGTLAALRNKQGLMIGPEGHYRGTELADRMLVYVAQTDEGQEVLSKEKFFERYGWNNDPNRVHILPATSEATDTQLATHVPRKTKPPAPSEAATGEPMSPMALVSRPAAREGIESWTLETIEPRGQVHEVAFSPDGQLLAAAGDDATIRLFEPKSMKLVRAMLGHEGAVRDIAWSPVGTTLASASEDGTVRFWDAPSGGVLRTLQAPVSWLHSDEEDRVVWRNVNSIQWSPDGETLATRGEKAIRLWDVETGDLHVALEGHEDGVASMAWSHDGKRLATAGGRDKTVRMWDAATGQLVHALAGHEHVVSDVAWSPDGKWLASASADKTVRLWDAEFGYLQRILEGDDKGRNQLAWSPDGKMLASSGGTILLWDLDTGDMRQCSGSIGTGRFFVQLRWLPDGRKFAWINGGHHSGANFHFFDTSSNKAGRVPVDVRCIDWSPNGQLAAGSYRRKSGIAVWEVASSVVRQELAGQVPLLDVAWSPDGNALAARRSQIDSARDAVVWSDAYDRGLVTLAPFTDLGEWTGLNDITWSPDGANLATAGGHKRASFQIWDVNGQNVVADWTGEHGGVWRLAWSPDGKTLAASVGRRELITWDVETRQVVQVIEQADPRLGELEWSPDSTTLAHSVIGEDVYVRDAKSGQELLKIFKGTGRFLWTPNGKSLITVGTEKIQEFALESGACVKTIPAQTDLQFVPAWSRDGNTLIYVDSDRKLTFLDYDSGIVLRQTDLASAKGTISPDERFASLFSDSIVRLVSAEDGQPHGTLVALRNKQGLTIRPDGHYRGTELADRFLVCVVKTADGQEVVPLDEFSNLYDWHNEPENVRLFGGCE